MRFGVMSCKPVVDLLSPAYVVRSDWLVSTRSYAPYFGVGLVRLCAVDVSDWSVVNVMALFARETENCHVELRSSCLVQVHTSVYKGRNCLR